ncbi:hypothetical protein HanRHA438_Chr00c06g0846171 [Helianthus annuus]|nr:hypothetical protein HanRHA438_Chr00c06g0846171 [Helianthus annuus]
MINAAKDNFLIAALRLSRFISIRIQHLCGSVISVLILSAA